MFKEIAREKQCEIEKRFPFLKYEELFPTPKTPFDEALVSDEVINAYHSLVVSAYDHWLSEEEEFISYATLFGMNKKEQKAKYPVYKNCENKFINFYERLFKYDFYLIYMDEHIVHLKNKRDFLTFIKQDIREMRFHRYIVPDLGILIAGNFDLSHVIHASKNFYKKSTFEEIVKESGLFILK